MQTAYFLGGISQDGFQSAFLAEQQAAGRYGFYLKGGPGTGKSTLLKAIAAAFANESLSLYHCASDPASLDAVVLEDSGIFAVDATAPHCMLPQLPYVTGQLVDCAMALEPQSLLAHQADISALAQQNTAAHAQVRPLMQGIGAMQELLHDMGMKAILSAKLLGFAERFAKRILPKKQSSANQRMGRLWVRQKTAYTPDGVLTLLPDAHTHYILSDPYHTAAPLWLARFVDYARTIGLDCETTICQTMKGQPLLHCAIPSQTISIWTHTAGDTTLPPQATPLSLQRFYDPAILRRQRTLARFCEKMEAIFAAQAVNLLAEARRQHDALERYYIQALQPESLQTLTAQTIAAIRARIAANTSNLPI